MKAEKTLNDLKRLLLSSVFDLRDGKLNNEKAKRIVDLANATCRTEELLKSEKSNEG